MHTKVIQDLLTILNQIKYYHWETCSFARHKALGDAYDSLSESIDEFVEILLGKYGKDSLQQISLNIRTGNEIDPCVALDEIIGFLVSLTEKLDCSCDTDLLNIRDEMLGTINHTKYLFTLQ
jgi:DNA-binding ferritin-like protein